MQELPDVLEDGDLTLRPPARSDLSDLSRQLNDGRVARWLAAVSQPFDAGELLEHEQDPGESVRLIERDAKVIGGLCIGGSLWYWLEPDHWRQGVMRRALRLAMAARFSQPAPPLYATCHVDNVASCALLSDLGFARLPTRRRMFFHGTRTSESCRDYLMAPEQWHLLNPPKLVADTAVLRPARQNDAAALTHMLPGRDHDSWPDANALPDFIETHRFRGNATGLFVVVDKDRRTVGMALVDNGRPKLRFLDATEASRHSASVTARLVD